MRTRTAIFVITLLYGCHSTAPGATADGGGGDDGGGSQTNGSITVVPSQIILAPGGSQHFTATVYDQDGQPSAVQPPVVWTVGGGGTIDATGVFTGQATAGGPFTVTATSIDGITGTAAVTLQASACASAAAVNTWENITAPTLAAAAATNFAYALDPNHPGTIYLGTIQYGIWKTTDCGSTWTGPINTGTTGTDASSANPVLGSVLSGDGTSGMNWTMAIDPTNSALYTVVGYAANGLYKSLDGGVNWNQLLPASIRAATENGFVNHLSMDPTNHLHLVADFHVSACTGTAPPGAQLASTDLQTATVVSLTATTATGSGTSYAGWGCVAETHDGGATWSLTTSGYPDINGDGPGIQVVNDKTWFFGTQGRNLWRTTTGGVPGTDVHGNPTPAWTQVNLYGSGGSSAPLDNALGFVYLASDGTFYSGGHFGVVHSIDGVNWTEISGEYQPALYDYNGSWPIVDNGTTLYVADTATMNQYWTAPLSSIASYTATAPTQLFTEMPIDAAMTAGAPVALTYDPVNHFIYSANGAGGFWRMKIQ